MQSRIVWDAGMPDAHRPSKLPDADRLSQLPGVAFGRRLVGQLQDDDVFGLAAGLAYRFLFAVFPFAIFVAALAAFAAGLIGASDPTDELIGALGDNMPPGIADQLRPQLSAVLGQGRPGLLTIGAVAALWAATGAVRALQKSLNRAYDVPETRNLVHRSGLAVGLTLLGSAGLLVAFVTIVGGSLLTQQLVTSLGIPRGTWDTVSLVRWPLMLALVAVAVAALLRFAPNVAVPFRWPMVGGVVFAVGWLVLTAAFALYVANFGSYSNTYGALGGVIVLMLWFYLTAALLLIAAELTSLLAVDHDAEHVAARRREIDDAAGQSDAAMGEVGRRAGSGAMRAPGGRP